MNVYKKNKKKENKKEKIWETESFETETNNDIVYDNFCRYSF